MCKQFSSLLADSVHWVQEALEPVRPYCPQRSWWSVDFHPSPASPRTLFSKMHHQGENEGEESHGAELASPG